MVPVVKFTAKSTQTIILVEMTTKVICTDTTDVIKLPKIEVKGEQISVEDGLLSMTGSREAKNCLEDSQHLQPDSSRINGGQREFPLAIATTTEETVGRSQKTGVDTDKKNG